MNTEQLRRVRDGVGSVSYTHLDVYKRQVPGNRWMGARCRLPRRSGVA